MAKIVCIDDFRLFAEMVAMMLEERGGHEVRSEIVPLDLAALREFAPDLIVLNLVRKPERTGAPLVDFYRDVDGAKALRAIAQNPETARYPLIITAIAVEERELPEGYSYLAFIETPSKFETLLPVIDRIVASRGRPMLPE